ncbi:MAG: hypothetical protein VB056_15715, partial [Sphaerochaeta associata]|uniref:hypothetical protein n=1 Tax=Sphaerochaeta associata TaxID=1129264 RepID=UPI002B211EAF
YLQHFIDSPETNNEQIIEKSFTTYYPWHYYFSKYQSFQLWESNGTEGYFYWEDFNRKPYECYMMYRRQFNGRHWNPFLLELARQHEHSIIENYGNDLQITYNQIILNVKMNNEGFVFYAPDGDVHSMSILEDLCREGVLNKERKLVIRQNDKGYDLDDRIKYCLNLLHRIDDFVLVGSVTKFV